MGTESPFCKMKRMDVEMVRTTKRMFISIWLRWYIFCLLPQFFFFKKETKHQKKN